MYLKTKKLYSTAYILLKGSEKTKMTNDDISKEDVTKNFEEIIKSNRISKFQEIVTFLKKGLGEEIYNDSKNKNHDILNVIRNLAVISPKETLYVFQQIYQYLSEKEFENNERIELATLYFWIGDVIYQLNRDGFGKYFLKAYIEDIAFHQDYTKGGAIEALKVRCYLGEKGINLIDKELFRIAKVSTMQELKQYLSSISRGEFERIVVELENLFSLEFNEDFFFPLTALKELILKIEPMVKRKTNKEKAILLEQLCQLLFGSIPGFKYKFDERSTLFQLDGFITNNSKNPYLSDLGRNIIVEAKQYFHRNYIDRKIIDILAMNNIRANATSAFLVTSARLGNPTIREIHHNYLRTGKYIIYLSFEDIKDIAEEKVSFPILISKKISDIRSQRKIK